MSQEFVRTFAVQNRRRLVAGLMEYFEKQVLPSFPANVRSQVLKDYRARVMQCVGPYHDFVLDLAKSLPDDTAFNEEAMALLQRLHQDVRELRSASVG